MASGPEAGGTGAANAGGVAIGSAVAVGAAKENGLEAVMSGAETNGFIEGIPPGAPPTGAAATASGAMAMENGEGWKSVVGDSGAAAAGGSGAIMDGAAAMENGDEAVVATMALGINGLPLLLPKGDVGMAPTPGDPMGAMPGPLAGSNCANLWVGRGTSRVSLGPTGTWNNAGQAR